MNKKNRILLDRKIRDISGLRNGAKLVAIPFKGGVKLVDASQRSFVGSMKGFAFDEEAHEASKFLFRDGGREMPLQARVSR